MELLDWLFDRINLDPKIQIKYIDTKNQFADILTKGNFTRDEWNRSCLQLHQTRGGPGMDIKILKDKFLTIERGNLWKRQDQTICKRIIVYPGLLKSGKVEMENTIDRGKPEENSWDSLQKVDPHREEYLLGRNAHSARYEETIHDRTVQLVSENLQGKAHFENFIMGSEITEFVNKVRDQARIRQTRMSSIAENCTEHPIIW